MPVGELFLGAFLQVLFDRLAPREFMQFLQKEGFDTKINKWKETFGMIKDVLADAEEKQLTDRAVKGWLDKLQDLAYDAEEMLDEFEYEATARKMKMESSKFWDHVPDGFCNWSLDAIRFRFRMRSKVNDVTTRFDRLCKLRQDLGLQVITGGASSTSARSSAAPQRPPTSSLPTGAVYGRDADKEKILEMVLKNEPNDANILVIPIVGMGGVGKTTLAREVYNHKAVESFQVKAWVCVSDGGFDVTRISMSILKDITASALDQKNFNTVHKELKQKIDGKKFLLVLDDVWSINYGDWETLKSPFMESALGSRIIVTTRNQQVASTITLNRFHPLGVLSNEDCWSVFLMCMFEMNETVLAHPDFKLIRKNVIEKCKGLPLAAKTLGGLLRSKQIDDWLGILNSKLWNLSDNDGSEIPAALKLSYHHLPSHLRRCFAYCAIFPKGYEFKIEEVVLLWIAEGLVQQSTENEQQEDLGCKYFSDLSGRSLFQQSSSTNGHLFVMHDLVHDLAGWAFGKISLLMDGESTAAVQSGGLEKVRHFTYISDRYDGARKFVVFQEVRGLKARIRTFLSIQQHKGYRNMTNSVLDLLPKLKQLRVLSLQSCCIVKVPIPVGRLKHLRYLNLSRTMIRSLPESTSLLYNLQILILRDCFRLVKLPSNFKYLIKLCHLDIKGAILIKEMPLGLKGLKNLQKLSNFIVGNGVGSSLKDLMSLKMLRGELCITKLDNVLSCDHKILRDKKDLEELLLEWGSQLHESRSEVMEEKVLDMLQPHENLQELTITRYGGTKFPPWVGAASYSKMKLLRLKNCEKCTYLPSLGALVSLEELIIKGMKGLTRISSEFYGNGQFFKSLKTLCFEDLPVWAYWEPIEENEYGYAFPCLQKLSIKECPQLSGSLPKCLFALEELVIEECEQLVVSFSNIPKLCKIEVDGCKRIACENAVDLKSIKYLTLSNISHISNQLMQNCFGKAELQQIKYNRSEVQLDEICPEKPPVEGLQGIRFLTELVISDCSNIVSFPEVCSLPCLSKLEIHYCNALISLPEEMKIKNACLESLEIWYCDSLTFIVRGQLPPSLKRLRINNCEKLESLWDDRENDKNTNSSLLESLHIWRCDSLAFIVRGQLPPSLKRLHISNCEKLESLWDDREGSCSSMHGKENGNNTNSSLLEYLGIFYCPSLTCLSSIIQLPGTLKHLEFVSCQKLTKLSQSGQLPASLKYLKFMWCPQLSTITEGFHDSNSSLEVILIENCEIFQIPNGLHNLRHLRDLTIWGCPNIECFLGEVLPNTNLRQLRIGNCEKLKALPIGLRSLNSLENLIISECPSITSFNPEEFPTNLKSLEIKECENVYRPLVEWGLQNLTSLISLQIWGHWGLLDVKSFPQQEMEMMLPPSLTDLTISNFPNLTQLWSQDFQNPNSLQSLTISSCPDLTSLGDQGLPSSLESLAIRNCPKLTCFPKQGLPSSLESLEIRYCPKLTCFPKQGLPSSLESLAIWNCPKLTCFPRQGLPSSLHTLLIYDCPKLKEECERNKGREWSKISNILELVIDETHL